MRTHTKLPKGRCILMQAPGPIEAALVNAWTVYQVNTGMVTILMNDGTAIDRPCSLDITDPGAFPFGFVEVVQYAKGNGHTI